jgi:hypothetical protein
MTFRLTPEEYARRQAQRQNARKGHPDPLQGLKACAAMSRMVTPESGVLKAVLATLEMHPKVAWVARINSGMFHVEQRFIKAGFKGCSDILGMLKGGRLLAVECKSSTGKETQDQEAFGARVAAGGGLYIVARSVDDVMDGLKSA